MMKSHSPEVQWDADRGMWVANERTIGEQAADAIEAAARSKTEALRARKLAERVADRLLLEQSGGTVDLRRAKVATHPTFIAADDSALQAESDAILAKAKADAWAVRFEEWRSQVATARAEMQLGHGMPG